MSTLKSFALRLKTPEVYWQCLVFLVVGVVYMLALGNLTMLYAPDSYSYLAVANDFSCPSILDRPIAYPFIIFLIKNVFGYYWTNAIVVVQIIAMALSGVLCFKLIRLHTFGHIVSFSAAVFAVCTPALISHSQFLLTEIFHSFFMTLTWYLTVLLFQNKNTDKKKWVLVLLLGLSSGVCVLIKPVWLMGIFPIVFACFWVLKKQNKKYGYALIALLVVHFIVVYSWVFFIHHKHNTFSISRVGTVNFNLTAIRAGLTKYGEGTPLYNYLDSTGQLQQALVLKWENNTKAFDSIKTHLPWEVRTDKGFSDKVMKAAYKPYLLNGVKRYTAFYKTGESSEGLFALLPAFFKQAYAFVYRKYIGLFLFLLPISMALCFWKKEIGFFQLLNASIIFYYYIILTLLPYYDSHFSRLRTSVDVIMIVTSLLPILYGLKFIEQKLRTFWKTKNATQ